MGLSNELTILLAALGAVIFLFAMDGWYRTMEEKAQAQPIELNAETPQNAFLEVSDEPDRPNLAA